MIQWSLCMMYPHWEGTGHSCQVCIQLSGWLRAGMLRGACSIVVLALLVPSLLFGSLLSPISGWMLCGLQQPLRLEWLLLWGMLMVKGQFSSLARWLFRGPAMMGCRDVDAGLRFISLTFCKPSTPFMVVWGGPRESQAQALSL